MDSAYQIIPTVLFEPKRAVVLGVISYSDIGLLDSARILFKKKKASEEKDFSHSVQPTEISSMSERGVSSLLLLSNSHFNVIRI